ncbi:MAG TPA: DinB family protein [Gemmatimonadaceae bacterium]|nr:DinB family protein [Gemmatimonadaceae bacterium]
MTANPDATRTKAAAWAQALTEHRAAVEAFAAAAAAIPPARWREPRAPGKWSPAQETEHVLLAYEASAADLAGGEPVRRQLPWWRTVALRWLVLPRILRTGRFPPRAPAPRVFRPRAERGAQAEHIALLRQQATAFEAALVAALAATPARRVEHPYFGKMALPRVLRLLTVHTLHHARVLGAAEGPAMDR